MNHCLVARRALVVALALGAGPGDGLTSAHAEPIRTVTSVSGVGMTVADMERSLEFFTGVLDFRPLADVELSGPEWERFTGVFGARMRVVTLGLGGEQLELTQYLAPEGRPVPADTRSNDRSFQHIAIITPDMNRAYARLREQHVRHASTGPQMLPAWNPDAGGIRAFYFKDPDGHTLEVLEFPRGKGDAKWPALAAEHPEALFLGIDHTAIVVSDTERSLSFYRDRLGLRVVGTSENYGSEQEHLNNVFGVRLKITALRSDRGPGVELLEYLAPTTGRDAPADSAANDVWHWHVRMITSDTSEVALRWAFSAWITTPPNLGFSAGISIKDPDGHVVQVVHGPPGVAGAPP